MGCGGSRLDPHGEGVPARLRPILQRRLEEIKRRRHSGILNAPTTQSKKQLLKVGSGVSDEETCSGPRSHHDDDHKSVSSYEDTAEVASQYSNHKTSITHPKMEKTAENPMVATSEATKPQCGKECKEVEADQLIKHGNDEDEKDKPDLFLDAMTPPKAELETMDRDVEGEDSDEYTEERRIRQRGGDNGCPGSPSFRVYFVESLHDNTDDEKKETDEKSQGNAYHGETTDSKAHAEVLEDKKIKKEKKVGGFRRAISKGRASAVKNLLHITSCYSVPCSGHHHTHITVQKEVSTHVR